MFILSFGKQMARGGLRFGRGELGEYLLAGRWTAGPVGGGSAEASEAESRGAGEESPDRSEEPRRSGCRWRRCLGGEPTTTRSLERRGRAADAGCGRVRNFLSSSSLPRTAPARSLDALAKATNRPQKMVLGWAAPRVTFFFDI